MLIEIVKERCITTLCTTFSWSTNTYGYIWRKKRRDSILNTQKRGGSILNRCTQRSMKNYYCSTNLVIKKTHRKRTIILQLPQISISNLNAYWVSPKRLQVKPKKLQNRSNERERRKEKKKREREILWKKRGGEW